MRLGAVILRPEPMAMTRPAASMRIRSGPKSRFAPAGAEHAAGVETGAANRGIMRLSAIQFSP